MKIIHLSKLCFNRNQFFDVQIRGQPEFEAIRQMVDNMLRVFEEQRAQLANSQSQQPESKRFKEEKQ